MYKAVTWAHSYALQLAYCPWVIHAHVFRYLNFSDSVWCSSLRLDGYPDKENASDIMDPSYATAFADHQKVNKLRRGSARILESTTLLHSSQMMHAPYTQVLINHSHNPIYITLPASWHWAQYLFCSQLLGSTTYDWRYAWRKAPCGWSFWGCICKFVFPQNT